MPNSITTQDLSEQYRIRKWGKELQSETHVPPDEHLPYGGNQSWVIWKTLNRLRVEVAKRKVKWGYQKRSDMPCECGEHQSDDYL